MKFWDLYLGVLLVATAVGLGYNNTAGVLIHRALMFWLGIVS